MILRAAILPALVIAVIAQGCSGYAFEDAKSENTPEAYRRFLAEHPDSDYADKARNALLTGALGHARESGNVQAYHEFVTEYRDVKGFRDYANRLCGDLKRQARTELKQLVDLAGRDLQQAALAVDQLEAQTRELARRAPSLSKCLRAAFSKLGGLRYSVDSRLVQTDPTPESVGRFVSRHGRKSGARDLVDKLFNGLMDPFVADFNEVAHKAARGKTAQAKAKLAEMRAGLARVTRALPELNGWASFLLSRAAETINDLTASGRRLDLSDRGGVLAPALITAALQPYLAKLQQCQTTHGPGGGKAVMELGIKTDAEGKTEELWAISSENTTGNAVACQLAALYDIRFARPRGGAAGARYKLEFNNPEKPSNAPPPLKLALTLADVNKVVQAHGDQVKKCGDRGGKRGTVGLRFEIEPEGAVKSVTVAASTVNDKAVESCLVSLAQGWTFPAVAQPSTVEYSFGFE